MLGARTQRCLPSSHIHREEPEQVPAQATALSPRYRPASRPTVLAGVPQWREVPECLT